jgi:hypothetical protein
MNYAKEGYMKRMTTSLVIAIFSFGMTLTSTAVSGQNVSAPQPALPEILLSNVQSIKVGNATRITAAGIGYAEMTTAALGPGENSACPAGRLFFASGSNVLMTDLDGNMVTLPNAAPNPWYYNEQETYAPHLVYDNHIARLSTGEIVHTFEGITWNDNISSHPSWWEKTVPYPLKNQSHPGGRGIIYVFRSADCGATWTRAGNIDAAKLAVPSLETPFISIIGTCGVPRLKVNPDTQAKYSEGGGFDGHYFYSDPYSGNLFISTGCVYGSGTEGTEYFRALLLVSKDKGSSWSVIGQKNNQWAFRAPISSNRNSVMFAMDDGQALKLITFSPNASWVDLSSATQVATYNAGLPPANIQYKEGSFIMLSTMQLASSNQEPPRFYAGIYNWIGAELVQDMYNTNAAGTAVQKINSSPARTLHTGGITVLPTWIEPLPNSPVTMAYWTDIEPTLPHNKYRIRGQVFSHGEPLLPFPVQLTVAANGGNYSYMNEGFEFLGDYNIGASYRAADGSIKFVAVWTEVNYITFNTITVAPPLERPWAGDWNGDGMFQKINELGPNKERLINLNSSVRASGEARYTGVWAYSDTGHPWAAGYTMADLGPLIASYHAQGYELSDLTAMVLPGDQVRYNAVWVPDSNTRPWVTGYTSTDLNSFLIAQQAAGYRINSLSAFVLSGSQVRYNAIFVKSNEPHVGALGHTDADLNTLDIEQKALGRQMICLNSFVMPGDQVRYNAIWAPSSMERKWDGGWAPADFAIAHFARSLLGFRLVNLNVMELSGDQPRYTALWELPRGTFLPVIRK